MDLSSLFTPEVINALVGVGSALGGAIGAHMAALRREKHLQKKTAKSEFDLLIQANEKFRTEIRTELSTARKQIISLEDDIKVKNREVEELKNSIADLRNELASKEKKISDMKIEIMKRDLQIEDLKNRISAIGKQTEAVVEMQNLQQRQLSGSVDLQ